MTQDGANQQGKVVQQSIIREMIRKDTRNWIALAEYDLETAVRMLETGRYLSGLPLPLGA